MIGVALVKLSRKLLPIAMTLSLSLAAPRDASAVGIMVNEYFNANDGGTITNKMAADEFIEFVITENTAASTLAGLTFGSTNKDTSALQGVFSFDLTTLNTVLTNAGQSQFLAGTIIVVKGANLGAQNLSYTPTVANATNHDAWSIELVAGSGALDNAETTVDGNLSVDNAGGVIWISSTVPTSTTDTSGFIAAIGHDQSPGAIASVVSGKTAGSYGILSNNIGTGKAVYNTATGIVSLTDTSTTGTLATPNGGANTTWIVETLRGAPEPSRTLLCFAGLLMALFNRRRPD